MPTTNSPSILSPSINCINLIKRYEGCKLNAYVDPGSGNLPITIGYGSTLYQNGLKIFMGQTITQDVADTLLMWEVDSKAQGLQLPVSVLQCRFDAIVSFAYNLGLSAWLSSTLKIKVLANPADPTIRAEFMKWVHAGGAIMPGLVKRRSAEADLYFSA